MAEAVDLGLSVKWASWNMGATKPEDYGHHYAWGETEPKSTYNWSTYKWCNGSSNTMTKYCVSSSYGTVDDKTVLDPEDDVAHVKWGGNWRMPTDEEWTQLRNSCKWTWTNNYNGTGVAGRIVTSNVEGYAGKSIFLPAAGVRRGTSLNLADSYVYYWSSSLRLYHSGSAWGVSFDSSNVYRDYYYRDLGQSVRPVTESR